MIIQILLPYQAYSGLSGWNDIKKLSSHARLNLYYGESGYMVLQDPGLEKS